MKAFRLLLLLMLFSFQTEAQVVLSADDASKFQYAKELILNGKYQLSIDTYLSEILNHKRHPDVFRTRGDAYRALGEYEKAAKDYSEAIQMVRDPQLYQSRGKVYFCAKNYERAEQDFNEAIRISKELNPASYQMNFLLFQDMGRNYHQTGYYKDAIENFKLAIENGSSISRLEVLASLFHLDERTQLRTYLTGLQDNSNPLNASLLRDSVIFNYLNAIKFYLDNNFEVSSKYISNAVDNYKGFGNNCNDNFINDLNFLRGQIAFAGSRDSSAYVIFKRLAVNSPFQSDIKQKVNLLKTKLGISTKPPVISLINPKIELKGSQDITVNKANIDLYGNVQDSAGLVSLTINGKNISKIEDDGGFYSALELQPGENKFVLVAIDKFENKAERTVNINFNNAIVNADDTTNIPELFSYANYHAILIAEKDYEDKSFSDLSSPINDANDLKKVLNQHYQFNDTAITTLYNMGGHQVLDSLEKSANKLTPDDNLIIFYAGHGDVKKIANKIVGGYLIPTDAKKGVRSSYISSEQLKDAVQACEAKHILFIVDACFGGTLMRNVMDDAPPGIKTQFAFKSRKILASGNVEEVPDQGKFIQLLIEFLKNNTQKYTSSNDLFSYLLKNAEGTLPQFNRIEGLGDNGGNFIFIKKD